jgi:hypothetical protein
MGWCKGDAGRGGRATAPFPPRAVDPPSTHQHPPSADYLDDLHAFDPATMTWTLLSAALDGPRPSARDSHGFTSAGGKLYVHGGWGWGIMADGNETIGDGCCISLSPAHTPCARGHAVPSLAIRVAWSARIRRK